MTDRVHSLTVVLDREVRTDTIEPLILALRMFRGVVDVKENVADADHYVAVSQARWQMRAALFKALEGLDF